MRTVLLSLGLFAVAAPVGAQDLVSGNSAISGVQARGYSIDGGPTTRQFAVPFATVLRVNPRLSIDIGAYYASTAATPAGGSKITLSGFTDTQVRGSYTFGRDALVASMMVNLPTGTDPTLATASVTGAAAANFLSFPVNNYSTGFSVTSGLAYATSAGAWNLGLAGSIRVNGTYAPFSDDTTRYSPGTEGRVRAAAERLFSNTRLVLGVTWSTFGNDEFTHISGGAGSYAPGDRLIGEASLSFLAGTGTITGFAWDYYRSAAGGSGSVANKENIFSFGMSGSWPVGRSLRLEPALESRFWSPEKGSGRLFSSSLGLQIPLGVRFTLAPSGRFDLGRVVFAQDGSSHNLTGWGFAALLRYQI